MSRRIVRTALALVGAAGLAASLAACGSQVATAEVGACSNLEDLSGELTEIPTVDCGEAHDAQFVHSFDIDQDGDFPGDDAIATAAQEGCLSGFESFIGLSYEESTLELDWIAPNESTWDQANDREVLCIAFLTDGSTVTESWEGAAV
ncbi:septum formation family protein [Occultella glacieicola]|nr:septum formation family protein [Occultella glacieicola]